MIRTRVTVFTGIVALFVVVTLFFIQREVRHIRMISEHGVWQQTRLADLVDEDTGWLNLAGLFWLEDGTWTIGSAPGNDFVLQEEKLPAMLGSFTRAGDEISFVPRDAASVLVNGKTITDNTILMVDDDGGYGEPTVLSTGPLQWWIISRDSMLGVRLRNQESLNLKNFAGIERFEFDSDWKVEAQFLPFESPRAVEYPTILGTMRIEDAPGVLVFELDGRQFEMVPFERKEGTQLFLVFGDQTNGNTTYEGGRFLYLDMPDERGKTSIDFNRAYNPPCAFSPYSTCPQPLRQNRLPVNVNAGEKVYDNPVYSSPVTSNARVN